MGYKHIKIDVSPLYIFHSERVVNWWEDNKTTIFPTLNEQQTTQMFIDKISNEEKVMK